MSDKVGSVPLDSSGGAFLKTKMKERSKDGKGDEDGDIYDRDGCDEFAFCANI